MAMAQQQERTELTWQNADPAGTVLLRNATVWTQDEAGILENADERIPSQFFVRFFYPLLELRGIRAN